MQISTLTGHLTATEKKHIAHLLTNKIEMGKINRKNYFIRFHEDFYSVAIAEKYVATIGDIARVHTHYSTFKTQG